jgi:antitoxin component of MazEF toxin-antitoxin module
MITPAMAELRVRRDGSIRAPDDLMDAAGIHPGGKVRVTLENGRLILEKVALADDPFAAAAKGPDVSIIEKIREQQAKEKQAARDRFDELIADPPEVLPEDNPDFWR